MVAVGRRMAGGAGVRPGVLSRRGQGGFTLLEVMVALTIFVIAFVGMMMLMSVMIVDNIETETEILVMERGRQSIEEIRALADSQVIPVGSRDRPGIMAVLNKYSQPEFAKFEMELPATGNRAQFVVALHTDETAIPSFITRLGDYHTVRDDQLSEYDRSQISFDINADGRFENILPVRFGTIRTLPVEVGVTWVDRNGMERFMYFTTLINR